MKLLGALVLAVLAGAVVVTVSGAGNGKAGFRTSAAPMLTGVGGSTVTPIISVGESLEGGYAFEALPDGISLAKVNGRGTVDILVNHELSKVPFPATRQDHSNALVSTLRLHQKSAGVLSGRYVIPSSAGYQRFCSNFLVGSEHGFERRLLFTNEEARDIVQRQEDSWHGPFGVGVSLSEPKAEQAGVVVAYDVKSRETARSTGSAATTTKTRSPSRATATPSCSRATTPSTRPRRSSTCTRPRTEPTSGTTAASCTRSSPTPRA